MSANTSIKEGGKGRAFGPVVALMVQGDDGKYLPWVPESERQLNTKSVNKNGVYQAKKEGVYGWRSVSVNVPTDQGVTGTDPTTGQQVAVGVDPTTGELTETVVPVEIRVTVPPTKTEYTHGEAINYSGIVVHAYDATGADMGVVPFNELIFPVTTADVGSSEWTDGDGINAMRVTYRPTWNRTYYIVAVPGHPAGSTGEGQVYLHTTALGQIEGKPAALGALGPAELFVTRYNGNNYAARVSGDDIEAFYEYWNAEQDGNVIKTGWFFRGATSGRTQLGKFAIFAFHDIITELPISSINPNGMSIDALHAVQMLPVQWSRPGDGAVLETSFGINITSAGGD